MAGSDVPGAPVSADGCRVAAVRGCVEERRDQCASRRVRARRPAAKTATRAANAKPNAGDEDVVLLIYGAPPVTGNAEFFPDVP